MHQALLNVAAVFPAPRRIRDRQGPDIAEYHIILHANALLCALPHRTKAQAGGGAAWQRGRQRVCRMAVLHHGAVRIVRGVDAVARFGYVKFLRVEHRQDEAARQATVCGKDDDLFAHGGRRPSARAARGPSQPFRGECRPEPHARLDPTSLYTTLERAHFT